MDREVARLYAQYDALLEHERRLFVPTLERFDRLLDDVRAVRRAADRLEAESGTPAAVVAENIREVLDAFDARVRTDREFPNRFVSQFARRLTALLRLDPRSDAERVATLDAVASQCGVVLDAVADRAAELPGGRREMAARTIAELLAFLGSIDQDVLREAMPSATAGALDALGARVRTAAEAARVAADRVQRATGPGAVRADGLEYDETLRRVYGIEIGDLLDTHRSEVERCRTRLDGVAAGLDPSRAAFQILDEDLGAYGSADAMYEAMRRFVALARERSLAYVTLPDDETCAVWRVPDYLRDSYPWGGYFSFGSPLAGEPRGAVFLNAYNYRTVTRGWVELNAIHECYPGHHAQFAKTAAGDMPLSFKVGTLTSRTAPLSEGMAVRTETLMQDIFNEPAFPLFVAYRRLHTALRIWVDLVLHHFRSPQPVEAAVALYVEHMRLPAHVARGQVYSQQLTPGYFATYYYGVKALEGIQARCGWDDRRFSELIFSCGKVSLGTLERLLALPEPAREALLRRFSTLAV
ncbi:MAG TPA: DUF885 family protein [bacterium]|nr:DUF885 family protein [bacterium]